MAQIIAAQLVDMLADAGVKRIYAVTGDSLNHFNDAVRKDGRIQWVHVRHEEAGAYAAAADAELNGIGCCAGSCGPGHVHLINGLYDAHRNGVPVIAIASVIDTVNMGTDYFQGTNTIKLFDDCSCYNELATTPEQAPRMLQTAIQHAVHHRGVAVFGLPGDLSAKDAVESAGASKIFRPQFQLMPSPAELQELAGLLNAEDKITIFCGIGAGKAAEEVAALSAALNAPVGYTFRAKMEIQAANPNEVGMTGLLGLPAAYHAMHEAGLVLLLGTDFPYTPFMPTDNKLVQVDERAEKLGRRCKLDYGYIGRIEDTLPQLLPLLKQKQDRSFLDKQLKRYESVKEDMTHFAQVEGERDLIQPEAVAATIDRLADSDAIFTLDTGMCCVWGARYIRGTGRRRFLGSFNHGSMANAMPMSIGAAFSFPQRQVIAFCGDGGISMLLGDLATIRQYKLPVKIIVFNNRSLGMVKLEMEVAGLVDNQTDMFNPDFAMVAAAMGFDGITVHEHAELEPALQRAFSTNGPVLVNIMTNPDALAMPPKLEWAQLKGFTQSMTRLMLSGRMDEVVATVKANYKHLGEML
jgi:pyruvate dehydrogenase (quinone)